jgi:hypothetical protein
MTSKAKLLANRRNAQKSTGPRTSKGKAIASKNSVKHGLYVRQTVISSEEQADFDLYRDLMLTELAPETPLQSMLAERIISLSWRLIRTSNIQNQTIDELTKNNNTNPLIKLTQNLIFRHLGQSQNSANHASAPDPAPNSAPDYDLTLGRMAIRDFSNARVLERLLMYERRLEHSLYKTILEFQRLQLINKINSESEVPSNKLTI